MSKHNARQMTREKLLFRYSSALERGDFETVAAILHEAEKDGWLSSMIAEMDAIYAQEIHPVHSMQTFSSNNHHEDYPMNTTYAVGRRLPPTSQRQLSWTLVTTLVASILLSAILIFLRSGGSVYVSQIPTMTHSPTPIPSSTPMLSLVTGQDCMAVQPINEGVNLHAQPAADGPVLQVISGMTRLILQPQSPEIVDWYMVALQSTGETGWVYTRLVTAPKSCTDLFSTLLPPATMSTNPQLAAVASPVAFFEYGGHVNDLTNVATDRALRRSGMTWVKAQIQFTPEKSGAEVLPIIATAHDRGFKILLTITGAGGDPLDEVYQQSYLAFLRDVAAFYPDAIEVWQEPNIDRWWPTNQISGQSYVNLLAQAYQVIKQANSNVMVISAAPAPTSAGNEFPGRVMNDDRWLQEVVSAGGLQYMDCLGAHYIEGVVSPLATSGDPRDNRYTRYFNTMFETYWNITGGQKSICWTEVGYLAPEGFAPPSDSFAWAKDTFAWEQGVWLAQAAALSARSGRVLLMIVWNVDFNTVNTEAPGYAIIRPDGSCPACEALAAVNIVIGLQVQRVLEDAVAPPSVVATALPIGPTPIAQYGGLINSGNFALTLKSDFMGTPAGTPVEILSAYFNGDLWFYEIRSASGQIVNVVPEPILVFSPGNLATLVATPTAFFDSALRQGDVFLTTTSPISDLPAGTRVKIKSAFFDGTSWSYQIETEDGRLYQAFEWQLVQTINPSATPIPSPTWTPTPATLCAVAHVRDDNLQVRARAEVDASVIGSLPPNTIADVIRQERGADGRMWYLIAAQIEDSRIEGWVLSDTVTQVEGCPAFQ